MENRVLEADSVAKTGVRINITDFCIKMDPPDRLLSIWRNRQK